MDHKKVLKANQDFYNFAAADYRKNESYAYSNDIISHVTHILNHCKKSAPTDGTFLDFGCGSGFLTEIVFKDKIFENVTGIDISQEQVKLYNKKFDHSNYQARVADIMNTGLESNSIDVAGCYSVLHHIYDYNAAIMEITRVLKPGGIFYCDFEPNRKFQELMALPVKIRRRFINKSREGIDDLERIAEYHNTINPGIDMDSLTNWLNSNYEILDIGPRFPKTLSSIILKTCYNFNKAFAPCFYIVARKIK